MAARTLEARFEGMSVNDENEPVNGGVAYQKTKVSTWHTEMPDSCLTSNLGITLNCNVYIWARLVYSVNIQSKSV